MNQAGSSKNENDRHLGLDRLLEHVATRVRLGETLDEACESAIDDVNSGRVKPHPPLRSVAFFVEDGDDD